MRATENEKGLASEPLILPQMEGVAKRYGLMLPSGWEQHSHSPFLLTGVIISGHLCKLRAPWAFASTQLHARTVEPTGS